MKKANKLDRASLTPPVQELIKWYEKNKRAFPWRKTWRKKEKNPYTILVSEVMLQQTTARAVIPYYEKFIKKFNTLKALAKAPLKSVLPYWSGLGYYSRIKNLHKAVRIINKQNYFPKTYKELLKLPGFGPYTARAVSSLAFNEKTGVLDANVIRVLTRVLGFKKIWWSRDSQIILQKEVDKWVKKYPSSLVNQALMELGSLVCTPKKPLCIACPIKKNCKAFEWGQVDKIPLVRKQKAKEIWVYQPTILKKNNHLTLVKNHSLPVLKNYPVFPGKVFNSKKSPVKYHFMHSITHHNIYVLVQKGGKVKPSSKNGLWVKTTDLKQKNPSSLMQKILSHS